MTRLGAIVGSGLVLVTAVIPTDPSPRHTPGEPDRPSGRTATLLPDGSSLLLGGVGPAGPIAEAVIRDPGGHTVRPVAPLSHARAEHTATLLPDGTVLVLGGLGADGGLVAAAELFDPTTSAFTTLAPLGLAPRAGHSATLLTDGRLLVAGGVGDAGEVVASAELWDPGRRTAVALPALPGGARQGHTAALQADGSVLLWAGTRAGQEVVGAVRFDPERLKFSAVSLPPSEGDGGAEPILAASNPPDGTAQVPTDVVIALRFSQPLQVETVSAASVILTGPRGAEEVLVVPAEAGRLAFVTPVALLEPGAVYTLTLHGAAGATGGGLPSTTIAFVTARAVEAPGLPPAGVGGTGSRADGAERALDRDTNWTGARRDGRPYSPWQSLPSLRAAPGVTGLAGQVLGLDGNPLAGVTVAVGRIAARTDATGRFLLTRIPAGRQELLVDGRRAGKGGDHGVFEIGVDVAAGQTNVLPFTSWLPEVDVEHAVAVPAPATGEIVVATPRIPGLELHLPAGSVIRDHEGRVATRVSITPIPADRTPFPLPPGIDTPVYFTIQPGAGYLEGAGYAGARLVYPNFADARRQPPGGRFEFWHYEPGGAGWYVYGHGSVDAKGSQVVPDPRVAIREFTGAMINSGRTGPDDWEPVGSAAWDGEPVGLSSGLFALSRTDLYLPDVLPLVLTRTYRPRDSTPRAFGIGTTHPYEMFLWSALQYQEVDLILPDGARVHYVRISPGIGIEDAVFEHTTSPTVFYKSRVVRTLNGGWDLVLRDGTVFHFGENAPLQSIRDRYGNRIAITRPTPTGNATRITSPSGRWIDFTYDTAGRITQARDSSGRAVGYAYDAAGRLATVTEPGGGVTRYTYDAAHRMVTLTDARNIVFLRNDYDAAGRVIRQTQADSSTYLFGYIVDASGRIAQTDVTDPRGTVRRVSFDGSGYVVSDTRALGRAEQQTMTYERQVGSRLVLGTVDALGRRTAYTYDALGNVTGTTRLAGTPQALTTAISYDPVFSQPTSLTDPLGRLTTFGRSPLGDLIAVTNPLGEQTGMTYDASGRLSTVSDAAGTIALTYDLADLFGVTDGLGNVVTRFSDAAGRPVVVTDPLGRQTRHEYDPLNRLLRVVDSRGGGTAFDYDDNGNLRSVTDARGSVTRYAHDAMDRVASRVDPLGHTESFAYDAAGNLTALTDRKGQTTTRTYDALNRPLTATFADGSTLAYTWDAGNRLTRIVDSVSGTITRSYDLLDRLLQEITPQGTVSYAYDAAGRRTSMTVAGQVPVTYAYDAADRVAQISQGTATVRFAYDAAGRRTSLTLPNGIVTEYAYDAASRLIGLTYRSGGGVLGTLTYDYDAAGQRVQVGGTWARTSLPPVLVSATYDAGNRQLTFGGQTLTYDLNGNLTSDGFNTYAWNARDQLTGVSGPDGVATFTYDALGRRQRKIVNGATTEFLYDRLNPVRELGATASTTLLGGLRTDEYFSIGEGSSRRTFLTAVLGSTIALADDSGTIRTEYTFEPFGVSVATAPEVNTFQYTGREHDSTGLYYHRARYYHPRFQRFISQDPIGFKAGDPNLYAYVLNNPIALRDPSGLIVLVCTRKIHGPLAMIGVNHQYLHCQGTGCPEATCGSLDGPEETPETDVCIPVIGSTGKEGGIMGCCRRQVEDSRSLIRGPKPYLPYVNDCFNVTTRCLGSEGLRNPSSAGRFGAPCGNCESPAFPPVEP